MTWKSRENDKLNMPELLLCAHFSTCVLYYRVCSLHGAAVWRECAPGKGLDHTWVPAPSGIQHACGSGASREATPAILWPRSRSSSLLQECAWRDTANKVRTCSIHIHACLKSWFYCMLLYTIKLNSVHWELVWKRSLLWPPSPVALTVTA